MESSIEETLSTVNADYRFPAVALAVANSEGILAAGAIGEPIAGSQGIVSADSRFHIGSVTKSMTATAIATIVEDGHLAWTMRPTDLFPELASTVHPALREVELRHLLSHRAGIAPFTEDAELEALGPMQGTPREQRAQFTAHLLQGEPAATPLIDHLYSNAGYAIAAAMAERAIDTPWESFIVERLLRPLGMDTAGIGWPAVAHANEPWGHFKRGDTFEPHAPNGDYQVGPLIGPAGDLHMSVTDMARFGAMHLRGIKGEDTILSVETVRVLHTPFGEYSLGWNESPRNSQHSGSAGTFLTFLMIVPGDDRVYAFATNAYEETEEESSAAHILLASGVIQAIRNG
jgi:CubicO group peptidase (beta-lactamase class C family)